MAFSDIELDEFRDRLESINKVYSVYNLYDSYTLMMIPQLLADYLDLYIERHQEVPYHVEIFFMHVLSTIANQMSRTLDNRRFMEQIFINRDELIKIAVTLRQLPGLEII